MTREEAIEIARAAAKAKPQSYYAEPFEPHEWVVDAILAASHTQDDEIDRLLVNRDNSCTCPHQDAREPLTNHGKTCPIRVNKVKRIAPEVAMERLAAALDASDLLISDCVGDPVHGHVHGHWVVCPVCVAVRTGRPLEQHTADAKLRAALLRACSMLDDAVQLRDDAEAWFPHIDDLRVIAGGTPGYGSKAESDK